MKKKCMEFFEQLNVFLKSQTIDFSQGLQNAIFSSVVKTPVSLFAEEIHS